MEKFVHKLINSKSGLCLHIIKIYRDTGAEDSSRNEKLVFELAEETGANSDYNMVPEIVTTKIGNHVIGIEEYVGPFETETSPTFQLMRKAEELTRTGDYAHALEHYNKLLALNEFHTVALNNISYCFSRLKDLKSAVNYQTRAAATEPNRSEYRKNVVEYAAAAGMPLLARYHFELLKKIFPHYIKLDELMVQVYKFVGQPEKIRSLSIYNSTRFKQKMEIDAEIRQKEKADQLFFKAKEMLLAGKPAEVPPMLKEALKTYDKLAFYKVNLAFSLARERDYQSAIGLLQSAVNVLSSNRHMIAYFNIGLNYLRLQEFESSLKYLDAASYLLEGMIPADGRITPDDLCGIGIWLDESGSLEEPLASAAEVLQKAYEQSSLIRSSDMFKILCNLYNQAAQLQEQRFQKR
jgi:tetratricopeptide (TPR) repeat protein